MTRRILLAITAATVLVFLGLLVPLWYAVRSIAVDGATRDAVLQLQPLVAAAAIADTDRAELREVVDTFDAATPVPATVTLADGTVIGPATTGAATVSAQAVQRARTDGIALTLPLPDGGTELVVPVRSAAGVVVVGRVVPVDVLEDGVGRSRWAFVGLGLVLLALAVGLGFLLARSLLRPVRDLATTAELLAGGDLTARVEPSGPPEIRDVGSLLNRLATRIGELLRGEREAVADLAHRLRTPVTALRLDVDAVREPEERERLSTGLDRVARTVDEVIHEARRPVREGALAECDAVAVVGGRVDFWSVLAEDQQRPLTLELPDHPALVRADADDLGDALDALLGNVFEHTDEGAPIAVRVLPRRDGAGLPYGAVVRVDDGGPGLPDTDVLTRGVSAGGGTGLGLDIARRTAESTGGALRLSRSDLGGARVELLLGPP